MPELLKSLVLILCLASVVFAFCHSHVSALATADEDFRRRRNLWITLTLIAFVTHDVWLCMFATGALLLTTNRLETNRLALFFFLLFAIPPVPAIVPGFGVINYFCSIDYLRLLALAILLPEYLRLRKRTDIETFGASTTDWCLAAYLCVILGVQLAVGTFTDTLRHVFYVFTDIFLPYYVASRSIRDLRAARDALMAFVMASLLLAPIALFEFTQHWLLYPPLSQALDSNWRMGSYLTRGESLRALASTGQPIALGYVMAIAGGLYLFLQTAIPHRSAWQLGGLALLGGLIAPLSRGPWVGAAAIALLFFATGPKPLQRMVPPVLAAVLALPILLANPFGNTLIDHLPFVGTLDAGNVTYRQLLFDASVDVILQNPWFGTPDYLLDPRMQEMMQGQGIIDVVNSYLEVALRYGLSGLALFVAVFVSSAIGIHAGMRRMADRDGDLHRLGQTLLAVLAGILVIIATVSSISVIPVIYWSMVGLGVAYARLAAGVKTVAQPHNAALLPPLPAWSEKRWGEK